MFSCSKTVVVGPHKMPVPTRNKVGTWSNRIISLDHGEETYLTQELHKLPNTTYHECDY